MSLESIFRTFPVLKINDEFVLRQIRLEDAERYLEYISAPEVQYYIPEECIPRTLERAKTEIQYSIDLFRYRRSIYWAIARVKDDVLVGAIGFNYWNRDHSRGEISYDLDKAYWGKGVMTSAVKVVLGYAFTYMQMHRIEATVAPTNKGSLAVLRKYKFKREGVLREQKLLRGKFYDAIMFSLLQREFFKF